MQLDYNKAKRLEGQIINFKNKKGEWAVGRVAEVKKDGLMIEEMTSSIPDDGYGFGFWGPGPFFGPPGFFGFAGFGFSPFFFW